MQVTRNTFVLILCVLCIYGIIQSALKVMSEPTTFEESIMKNHGTFPSITVCEQEITRITENYKNFDDILEASYDFEVTADFEHSGLGVVKEEIDLNDDSALIEKLNITTIDIWSYGATLQYEYPHSIIICKTLDLTFIKSPPKQGDYLVKVSYHIVDSR